MPIVPSFISNCSASCVCFIFFRMSHVIFTALSSPKHSSISSTVSVTSAFPSLSAKSDSRCFKCNLNLFSFSGSSSSNVSRSCSKTDAILSIWSSNWEMLFNTPVSEIKDKVSKSYYEFILSLISLCSIFDHTKIASNPWINAKMSMLIALNQFLFCTRK